MDSQIQLNTNLVQYGPESDLVTLQALADREDLHSRQTVCQILANRLISLANIIPAENDAQRVWFLTWGGTFEKDKEFIAKYLPGHRVLKTPPIFYQ